MKKTAINRVTFTVDEIVILLVQSDLISKGDNIHLRARVTEKNSTRWVVPDEIEVSIYKDEIQ